MSKPYRLRPQFVHPPGVPWAERMRKPPKVIPTVSYPFPLRPNMIVYATLPVDLTPEDAERINGFIRALALPEVKP